MVGVDGKGASRSRKGSVSGGSQQLVSTVATDVSFSSTADLDVARNSTRNGLDEGRLLGRVLASTILLLGYT